MFPAAGKDGVGKVFQLAPAIMRCKPTIHDRWERRIVELAAFLHRHGHCNVPEVQSLLIEFYIPFLFFSLQWLHMIGSKQSPKIPLLHHPQITGLFM